MCAVRMLAANKVTYSEFKILHESKTKSDKRSNFWIGGFLSLFGIIIFVAAVTGLIKSSSPVLPYILLLVFETGGILIIY